MRKHPSPQPRQHPHPPPPQKQPQSQTQSSTGFPYRLSNEYTSTANTQHRVGNSNRGVGLPPEIVKLNDKVVLEALREGDWKVAAVLIEELLCRIEESNGNEKGDYGVAGGRLPQTNKRDYFLALYIAFYNKACLSQQKDNLEDCHKQLEKAVQNFQTMQAYLQTRQQLISSNIEHIQLLLQLCAVMSQNGKHDSAIALAQRSLGKLIQSFRMLEAICYQGKLLNLEPETTENSVQGDAVRPDRVDFRRVVMREAAVKLAELANLPTIHKLVLEDKDYYEKIIKNIYFWKDNVENNEKILRKQLDTQKTGTISPRNILGLHKKPSWIEQFHIGTLMCLKPKKLKLDLHSQTYTLLSSHNILQMALYTSVCYFTIATEIRFNEFELDLQSINISQKYKRLHTNQTIRKCKLIHIKALEIATKYLPPSNFFLNHLLSSFNKNYKFLLDEIGEESELASNCRIQENAEEFESEYGIIRPTVKPVEKKMTRKRSKTNDKLKVKSQSKTKLKN